jgi:hypothetical protein
VCYSPSSMKTAEAWRNPGDLRSTRLDEKTVRMIEE